MKSAFIAFILLCLVSKNNFAQLCQGSLGDPLVNNTFGAGPNPGAPLAAATTNYQYVSNDCPPDGSYTVRNNTLSCFGSTWHAVTSDHTGNANGYFMLVNASLQPSAFYLDTVKNLCANTTYEFAAWIMNVQILGGCNGGPNVPNLTFRIEKTDGTVLQTYNTNNINTTAAPIWRQYGFFFTTPAGVSDVVLRIVNNASGGCGNDLALDDITFRPCGPQLTVTVNGSLSPNVSFCQGITGSFSFAGSISSGFNNPAYQWQESSNGITWVDVTGASTTNYTRTFSAAATAGTYYTRLTVAEAGNLGSISCRTASQPVIITIHPIPSFIISSNSPVCAGTTLSINVSGNDQFVWTGPGGYTSTTQNISLPNATVLQAGKYLASATNAFGCTKSDSTTVVVNPAVQANVNISSDTICEGETLSLIASGGSVYQWLPVAGVNNPTGSTTNVSPKVSTNYQVIVGNNTLCRDTAFVDIKVVGKPVALAGDDKFIIEGQAVQLSGQATGFDISYNWLPAPGITNTASLTPTVNPVINTRYILVVRSNAGCGMASDSVTVRVLKKIIIPNAFSPNGDGINDTWEIPGLTAYSRYELVLFNRYGLKLFESINYSRPWNGKRNEKPLPVGTYYYLLNLKEINQTLSGSVTIIR